MAKIQSNFVISVKRFLKTIFYRQFNFPNKHIEIIYLYNNNSKIIINTYVLKIIECWIKTQSVNLYTKEINQNKKNVILSVNCVRCVEEL